MPTTSHPNTRRAAWLGFLAAALTLFAAIATDAPAATPAGSLPYSESTQVPNGQFAFNAGIRSNGATRFFCSGTLIGKRWVLTAAHCVDDKAAANLQVVIGDTDLDNTTDPAELRAVERIRVHPKWGGDTGDGNDVALLRLVNDSNVTPVRLGLSKSLEKGIKRCESLPVLFARVCPSGLGFGLGWGKTTAGGQTSLTLRQAKATIFGGPRGTFWKAKSGACKGDSGGPLMIAGDDGSPVQIGVASYITHGGKYFSWWMGGMCDRKGVDFYSDVSAPG